MFYRIKLYRCILQTIFWIYRGVTRLRNYLYDRKWLPSISFPIPVICIGNLSIGGTGKTPHTEYLIRLFKDTYKVAVLSRGYGRKTKGFVLADNHSTAEDIGDEPLQYFKKFGHQINIAVDENRVHGIKKLYKKSIIEIVLLDDAFQHRRIRAGLNILLTDFYHLYSEDTLFPIGCLREDKIQAKRANIIIITKCPDIFDKSLQREIINKLKPEKNQEVFFSFIQYSKYLKDCYGEKISFSVVQRKKILLITGIARPDPLVKFLKKKCNQLTHISYPDHYKFQKKDYLEINTIFNSLIGEKYLLTTEKDFMRINIFNLSTNHILYIPIFIRINQKNTFDQKIIDYVKLDKNIMKK